MSWTEGFIERCLEDVPQGRYRRRAEAELRDHLECLRQSSTEAEALSLMGDPELLRKKYYAAWSRTFQAPMGWLGAIAGGCLLMGTLYLCTAVLLSLLGFTYDGVGSAPIGRSFPMVGNPIALTIFGSALFLVPFSLGALYLRFRFRKNPHCALWVTLGLLAAWAGEKAAIICPSALIYQMPLSLDLLNRISRGGDVTGPWFTPEYIVWTFVGCLMLGHLFGQKREGKGELA